MCIDYIKVYRFLDCYYVQTKYDIKSTLTTKSKYNNSWGRRTALAQIFKITKQTKNLNTENVQDIRKN